VYVFTSHLITKQIMNQVNNVYKEKHGAYLALGLARRAQRDVPLGRRDACQVGRVAVWRPRLRVDHRDVSCSKNMIQAYYHAWFTIK
jgi:hypothetical protein